MTILASIWPKISYTVSFELCFHATFLVIMYSRRKKNTQWCILKHCCPVMNIGYFITKNFATASIYCTAEWKLKNTQWCILKHCCPVMTIGCSIARNFATSSIYDFVATSKFCWLNIHSTFFFKMHLCGVAFNSYFT